MLSRVAPELQCQGAAHVNCWIFYDVIFFLIRLVILVWYTARGTGLSMMIVMGYHGLGCFSLELWLKPFWLLPTYKDFGLRHRMQLTFTSPGGKSFELEVLETDKVRDVKDRIREYLALNPKQVIKLCHVVGTCRLFQDEDVIGSCGLESDCIQVIKSNPGPIILCAPKIRDRTPSSDPRPGARSPVLSHPVEKLEISVEVFRDQLWGNRKSSLLLEVWEKNARDGSDVLLFRRDLYHYCNRDRRRNQTDRYPPDDHPADHPEPLRLDIEDKLVQLAKPGTFIQMAYRVGAGGGHEIYVENWKCVIYYESPADEVSDEVEFSYPPVGMPRPPRLARFPY